MTKITTRGKSGGTYKTSFGYAGSVGATMPALLEVSVWKAKPECRDKAVIQKMLDEIKKSAGG